MPIPLGDLPPPRYFYVASFTESSILFSIRESDGNEICLVSFSLEPGVSPVASFPLAVWTYKQEASTLRNLFNGIIPAGSPNALKRFLVVLKRKGILRYTLDRRSGTWIPWKHRHNAENFVLARTLIVGGRFRG